MWIQKRRDLLVLILLVFGILVGVYFGFRRNYIHEGFEQQSAFVLKTGQEKYDLFYAQIYATIFPSTDAIVSTVDQIIRITGPMTTESHVLDAGCGIGKWTSVWKDRNIAVVGVDSSNDMIAVARQTYPSLTFQHGSLDHSLLFEPQTFSHVVLGGGTVFELVPEQRMSIFHNMWNWSRSGSRWLVVDMREPSPYGRVVRNTGNYTRTQSTMSTDGVEYQCDCQRDEGSGTTVWKETFRDRSTNVVRANEHTWYVDRAKIRAEILQAGWKPHYDSEILWIFH